MKLISCFVSIIILTIFSCSDNKENNSAAFNKINDRLNISVDSLRALNDSLETSLATKLLYKEKATKQAKLWGSKADTINIRTIEINNYIMECLADIGRSSKRINTTVFYNKLIAYKNIIREIDPEINSIANENAYMITYFFDSVKKDNPAHFTDYLANNPEKERLIIIKRTLYNVHLTKNKILFFCNTKVN